MKILRPRASLRNACELLIVPRASKAIGDSLWSSKLICDTFTDALRILAGRIKPLFSVLPGPLNSSETYFRSLLFAHPQSQTFLRAQEAHTFCEKFPNFLAYIFRFLICQRAWPPTWILREDLAKIPHRLWHCLTEGVRKQIDHLNLCLQLTWFRFGSS